MNIQQLNNNGQNIWVFVVTASVALLLTYLVWLCTEQFVDFTQWRKQMDVRSRTQSPWAIRGRDYNLLIRLAVLAKLLVEGHGRWLWVTGAWIRILENERFMDRPKKIRGRNYPHIEKYYDLRICDYVCECITSGPGWEAFFDPVYFTAQSKKA